MAELTDHQAHIQAIDRRSLEILSGHNAALLASQQHFVGVMSAVMGNLAKQAAEMDLAEALAGKHAATGNVPAEAGIAAKTQGNVPPVTPTEIFTREGGKEGSGGV